MMFRILPSRNKYVHLIFWGLALFHLFIPLCNHFLYRTFAYDFAVYNFAFYDFAHFRNSPCLLYHSMLPITFWQDHFSLLLPILSPLYWLLAPILGTYSLLFLQWVFITTGALFTFRLIAALTKDDVLALLSIVLYFLIHGRFSAYRTDVNLVIMGSAMVPAFIYFFYRRKKALTWIVFALLLVTREDFSLWLVFICLFLAIEKRREAAFRTEAILLGLAALLYFVACFLVFIPVFLETQGRQYDLFEYKVLGAGPGEAAKYLVHDPVRVFQLLFVNHNTSHYFDYIKADFYLCYFISGLALLLLRPKYLIVLIPLIAKKMLNDQPMRWGTESYYAVEFATVLPLLVFMAISRFKNNKLARRVAVVTCVLAFTCTLVRFNSQPVPLLADGPQKTNPFSPEFYKCEYDRASIAKALSMIPPGVPASASSRLTAHLAFRDHVYLFPRKDEESWVILLKKGDSFPLSQEECDAQAAAMLEEGGGWKLQTEAGDVLLLSPLN